MGQATEEFIHLSQLHKLRRCEQVAAVCYRVRGRSIEFLLVQTGSGRWTFPKGSTEPGLTHAQAAAIEAFEEAGVHGRIAEASFGRYAYGTRYIHAHLCEVLRLEPPREFGRAPTWFTRGQAKWRLRQGRGQDEAAGISGIVDQAVVRIEQQRNKRLRERQASEAKKDALQKVQFEAEMGAQARMESALLQYARGHAKQLSVETGLNGVGRRVFRGAKVLQLRAAQLE